MSVKAWDFDQGTKEFNNWSDQFVSVMKSLEKESLLQYNTPYMIPPRHLPVCGGQWIPL